MNEPLLPNAAAWKDSFQSAHAPVDSLAKDGAGGQWRLDPKLRPARLSSSAENALGTELAPDRLVVAGARPNEPRLLSQEAETTVGGAFGSLAQTIIAQRNQVLETHMTALVRVHLQRWLNLNLPVLVERLVKNEIERIARTR
jgi:uncharacterized protein